MKNSFRKEIAPTKLVKAVKVEEAARVIFLYVLFVKWNKNFFFHFVFLNKFELFGPAVWENSNNDLNISCVNMFVYSMANNSVNNYCRSSILESA